jgi:hypothetical protein
MLINTFHAKNYINDLETELFPWLDLVCDTSQYNIFYRLSTDEMTNSAAFKHENNQVTYN